MSQDDEFLWGTATSGHQVEGDNHDSDWWDFERRRLAVRSGPAARFIEHFEADLDIARELGTNAFRFSLEWARIEPRPGERDAAAVAYYDRLIEACLARGLRPVLTLVHFTLPRWCREGGRAGWLDESVQAAFVRHVRWVAQRYGDRIDTFVTVNEPAIFAFAGYFLGFFPPGLRGRRALVAACELALVRAHAEAYHVLHEEVARRWPGRRIRVGPAKHLAHWTRSVFDPGGRFFERARRFNWRFLDAIVHGVWLGPDSEEAQRIVSAAASTTDFIGINYYTSIAADPIALMRIGGMLPRRLDASHSDLGLPIAPDGFETMLSATWTRYELPILVTENGLADAADSRRARFLETHLAALERARAGGAQVFGYMHWALVDNFEWHVGFWPRFGLVSIDYSTQARTVRQSAWRYAELIAQARQRAQASPSPPSPSARG